MMAVRFGIRRRGHKQFTFKLSLQIPHLPRSLARSLRLRLCNGAAELAARVDDDRERPNRPISLAPEIVANCYISRIDPSHPIAP